MATYYIRNDGSDSNNGTTQQTAFKTFAKAQSVATNSDTITLLPDVDALPESLISADEDNALSLGDDGKLFVESGGGDTQILSWTGRFLQTGENDPTGLAFSNTLGTTLAFGRADVGAYNIIPAEDVFNGKYVAVTAYANQDSNTMEPRQVGWFYGMGAISLLIKDSEGVNVDVHNFLLKIEAYDIPY